MPFGEQHFGEVASDGADSASRARYQDRSGVWPLRCHAASQALDIARRRKRLEPVGWRSQRAFRNAVRHWRSSSLKAFNQYSQGFRLLVRREVTAGQMFDLEAEFAETFIRKLDLSVFKGVFVAAAHQKRELTAIGSEELIEVESVTLRFVISYEARCGGEVEQAIVTVHSSIKLADFAICYPIAFGPHHPCQHLEQRERTAQTPA